MDLRTKFYLTCWKNRLGLHKYEYCEENMVENMIFHFKEIIASGSILITERKEDNTWVALFESYNDSSVSDTVKMYFYIRPSVAKIKFTRLLLFIEDFFSFPKRNPYVYFHKKKIHWTVLPFNSMQEKWENYLLLSQNIYPFNIRRS